MLYLTKKGCEAMLAYYFLTLLFFVCLGVMYLLFRYGVQTWLQLKKQLSETRIRKLKKGKKNFWWYQALHDEVGMGLLYPLNKGFTLVYALALGLSLVLGWWKPASVVLCGLMILLCLSAGVMVAFTLIWVNIEEHGRPIVFLAQRKNQGLDSVIIDVAAVLFCLIMGYAHILLTADLWGMDLRFW
jgi:hypothetical protein